MIRASGLPAEFDRRDAASKDARLTELSVREPVADGHLRTRVGVLRTDQGLSFRCSLEVETDGGVRAPDIEIRVPRFVRDVLKLDLAWRIGPDGERVSADCLGVGGGDVDELVSFMDAPQRRLPVILVSEIEGETVAGDLHERVGGDTVGLAHTRRLTWEASWKLTEAVGKEWSCYNGAVRLLWPFRMNRDHPRAHPVWTYDTLMRRGVDERAARDRLRIDLRARLFEASTFVTDDPGFARFAAAKARRPGEAARDAARERRNYAALADLYAKENDELRTALAEKTRDVEVLQARVEALGIALRSGQAAADRGASEAPPPQTVAEAMEIARTTLADRLAFAEEIQRGLAKLNTGAGPPDKVLRYLQTLAQLSGALASDGSLGRSIPIWLKERNVECSGESETGKGNREAKRRRTFRIGGEDHHCDFHAKPSDGVSPDMCVRIYFAVCASAPRIRIGYVGRHFD